MLQHSYFLVARRTCPQGQSTNVILSLLINLLIGGFIFEVYLHFRNQSCLKFNDNDSLKEILYVSVLIFFL